MVRPSVVDASRPVRTCIGCRERVAKSELIRVVADAGDEAVTSIVPDLGGSAPGRGAHLHPTTECYELAVRRHAFARALRLQGGRNVSTAQIAALLARSDHSTDQDWSTSS